MKRYVFAIAYCIIAAISYAECTTITDTAVSISRWQEFYTPVYDGDMECWIVELQTNDPVLITYNICLDLYSAFDYVNIFELDENNNVTARLKHAWGVEEPGVIISTSNRFKVEYGGVTGNVDGTYEGFQLHFKKATQTHLTEHDYYIMGKVGIGTTHAKATLHVNGSIYGGEPFGATILKSKSGYVSIGTSMQQPTHMEFLTDRNQFIFNKPILNQTGILGSTTNTLQFTTNDSTRMAIVDGKIGIGTSSPSYMLDVAGTIRANEIIVNTTGADFVFAEDYRLRPLSEVKAFIQENKHLPDIKSAQEMQENGVGVNELQTQLLQKIEELTLYILQQEERIRLQEERIDALEKK